jgi:hypothetical protein
MGAKKPVGKGGKAKKKKKISAEDDARQRANAINDVSDEQYKINLMTDLQLLRDDTKGEDQFAALY